MAISLSTPPVNIFIDALTTNHSNNIEQSAMTRSQYFCMNEKFIGAAYSSVTLNNELKNRDAITLELHLICIHDDLNQEC